MNQIKSIRKLCFIPLLFLLLFSLSGCASSAEPLQMNGMYFDTIVTIRIWDTSDRSVLEECEKLDNWSEDRKFALDEEIKDMDKLIKEKKREMQFEQDSYSLSELLEKKAEIQKLTKNRTKKRQDLFAAQDQVDEENDRLQLEMRRRLKGENKIETIFTIRYEVR